MDENSVIIYRAALLGDLVRRYEKHGMIERKNIARNSFEELQSRIKEERLWELATQAFWNAYHKRDNGGRQHGRYSSH